MNQESKQCSEAAPKKESLPCSTTLNVLVRPGLSSRADFPLIPSKTALLIIDVQDYLSSSSSSSSGSIAKDQNRYLFSTALKKAIPNMVQLVDAFRSIRDTNIVENSKSMTTDSGVSPDNVLLMNCQCEVIFTYLESLTPDRRDISLDYKLSGPLLSMSLPSSATHKATFDELPLSLHPNPSKGKGDILLPKTSCSVFQSTNINYVLRNLHIEQLVVCGQLTDQCVLSAVRDAADLGYFVSVVEDACAASSFDEHERGILGMKGFARIMATEGILAEIKQETAIEQNTDNNHVMKNKEGQGIYHDKLSKPSTSVSQNSTPDILLSSSITPLQKWESMQRIWEPSRTPSSLLEPLLHTLQSANIKFLRYASIDITNNLRTKVIPIHDLLQTFEVYNKVSIAQVCMGGLPSYADVLLPETGLNAQHVLMVQPEMSSLRILPYTMSTAMVFGTLHQCQSRIDIVGQGDKSTLGSVSEFCTRSLLHRVLYFAKEEHGIGFAIGAEIEFILVRRRNGGHHSEQVQKEPQEILDLIEPIDLTVFASTTTLNEQDAFLNDVYDTLRKQNINIETFHSESAPGQLEVVIPYQKDAVKIADMIILTRETIKSLAKNRGLCTLFIPKVFENSAGNGMHVHLSFYSTNDPNKNLFPMRSSAASSSHLDNTNDAKNQPMQLKNLISEKGQSFLEGILSHLRALTSLTLPTSNSYQRVGEGCWTGHTVDWMVEEKEFPLRVCLGWSQSSCSFEASNVEFKLIDNTCNVYLALAAILFAGLDGISQNMKLRPPRSGVSTPATATATATSKPLPVSLEESLEYLSADSVLSELLGVRLKQSYIAVKKAEVKHAEGRSIVALVSEELKR